MTVTTPFVRSATLSSAEQIAAFNLHNSAAFEAGFVDKILKQQIDVADVDLLHTVDPLEWIPAVA